MPEPVDADVVFVHVVSFRLMFVELAHSLLLNPTLFTEGKPFSQLALNGCQSIVFDTRTVLVCVFRGSIFVTSYCGLLPGEGR